MKNDKNAIYILDACFQEDKLKYSLDIHITSPCEGYYYCWQVWAKIIILFSAVRRFCLNFFSYCTGHVPCISSGFSKHLKSVCFHTFVACSWSICYTSTSSITLLGTSNIFHMYIFFDDQISVMQPAIILLKFVIVGNYVLWSILRFSFIDLLKLLCKNEYFVDEHTLNYNPYSISAIIYTNYTVFFFFLCVIAGTTLQASGL